MITSNRGGMVSRLRLKRLCFATVMLVLFAAMQPAQGGISSFRGMAGIAAAQGEGRLYTETGYTLAPEFVAFFDKQGGVPQFGYPVTAPAMENGYLVQWTERQRLEWHPENAGTEFEVLLGLLGRELTHGLDGPRFQRVVSGEQLVASAPEATPEGHFFKETGQFVGEPFYSYWVEHGGLAVFGYPISTRFTDSSSALETQWFERARFEIHPENPPESRVLLGHLGYEALKARRLVDYRFDVFPNAAPDASLQIGLAQGGESEDPDFFANVREQGAALGPGLVRLDNIFNFYGIVRRGADGVISYSWERFDRVLDGVRAMGKEPLICLSYMPETMSVSGQSRVEPPREYAEWANLVRATVTHVNVERKLGVRFWEVWNEPDQWGFWQAPFPEYLRLYDVTVEAALEADPSVMLGGPSVSRFSTDHLGEFLEHERWQVEMGLPARVDFLSWHSYGHSPDEVAADIRQARRILEDFPQFSPQIFISEFNILQGGAGDTSASGYTDTVEGAIAFLSSIEGMQRERLDRAFLFELKDGPDASGRGRSFWGRWGVLTFDGKAKPIYYALKAFLNRPAGSLPVALRGGPADGSLGLMAFGGPGRATVMLWYTGAVEARVKVALPSTFLGLDFDAALFDHSTNNPALTGDAKLHLLSASAPMNAGDLVFDLKPFSLVVLSSR